jgi:hypothetical protein
MLVNFNINVYTFSMILSSIIWIVLYCCGVGNHLEFLFSSFGLILFIFYIRHSFIETFRVDNPTAFVKYTMMNDYPTFPASNVPDVLDVSSGVGCVTQPTDNVLKSVPQVFDSSMLSYNAQLIGKPTNPNLNIAPRLGDVKTIGPTGTRCGQSAPIYSEYWSQNVPSGINSESLDYDVDSGYRITRSCKDTCMDKCCARVGQFIQSPPECINSNKGITYLDTFQPYPQLSTSLPTAHSEVQVSDVYDPRFSGFGSPNRSFYDKNSGTVKYDYKDIDSVKRPNYFVRSNVDHIVNHEDCGGNNYKYNNMAFIEHTNLHRSEMQNRLMRKHNAESWQKRVAPLSRASNSISFRR